MSPTPGHSYEELEKRRSEELSTDPKPRRGSKVLLVVFLAFAALTIYFLAGSSLGFAPATYTVPEATALVAAGSLFGYRMQTRRSRGPGGSLRSSLLDVLTFFGIVALAAWTFVFPILYPLPQQTAVTGIYSLILIAAMIVVLRFATPGLRGSSDDAYSNLESSLNQLKKAVDHLSRQMPQGGKSADPAVAERLSAMMGEVAAMKKELSSIKTGGGGPSASSSVSSVRVYAPSAKAVVVPPQRPSGSATPAAVVRPEGMAKWSGQEGISVPDSTVDNPWLDVLAKRRAKKDAPAQPPGQA